MSATQNSSIEHEEAKAKFLQSLGLAIRARCAVAGSDAVMEMIQARKARLVILASDAGQNARKKYRDKCAFYHIPVHECFTREQLGHACGRSHSVVAAVTDPGFAAKMALRAGEFSGGEAFDETESV